MLGDRHDGPQGVFDSLGNHGGGSSVESKIKR